MTIQEIKLLSEALWASVKQNLDFFSSIQVFVRKLTEFDFTAEDNYDSLYLIVQKIDDFFNKYRKKTKSYNVTYIEPQEISDNNKTFIRIYDLVQTLKTLSSDERKTEIAKVKTDIRLISKGSGSLFIGHGRSKLWARVKVFLEDELQLTTVYYEKESHVGESIINVLSDMLNVSSFAVLIFTAEDEAVDGTIRARQNVIHEAGLFQGRIGFDKVIILKQEEVDGFTNIAGLQHIPFTGENIEQTFYDLTRKLKKEGMIKINR